MIADMPAIVFEIDAVAAEDHYAAGETEFAGIMSDLATRFRCSVINGVQRVKPLIPLFLPHLALCAQKMQIATTGCAYNKFSTATYIPGIKPPR